MYARPTFNILFKWLARYFVENIWEVYGMNSVPKMVNYFDFMIRFSSQYCPTINVKLYREIYLATLVITNWVHLTNSR